MRQREDGACFAYSKGDGSCFVLPRAEHQRLRTEWMAGKAFFDGRGFYGSAITIRLGDIAAVSESDPDMLRCAREDAAADAREDAIDS